MRLGFLSFGHWQGVPGSQTRTAQDALLQSIDLAVAAEELGLDGAFFRVHHFARQLASPFPLLSAIAARTKRIEIGTGVIDMRYENPLYMAEEAAAADLISSGRLQLGVSRGSPETALRGSESFGFVPPDGMDDADLARAHTELFLAAITGAGVVESNPQMTGSSTPAARPATVAGTGGSDLVGCGLASSGVWTAEHGMNLMSSTLLTEDTGVAFSDLQAEQIQQFRDAWKTAGWDREPRVSVSRSILPITTDEDRAYFGARSHEDSHDQVGYLDATTIARFGKSYIGDPEKIVEELVKDAAVREADTVLLTVPNQLGVEYNTHLLETVAQHIAPAIGWTAKGEHSARA